jgi:hypothetical protein
MTPEKRDRMDLDYLLNMTEEPDMSPHAVTQRMELMGQLCELSTKLGIPYIRFFERDGHEQPGRDD